VVTNIAPGEQRVQRVARANRRLFDEALSVAMDWKANAPWSGPIFLQLSAGVSGRSDIWLNVERFNLSVEGYLDRDAWTLPVHSDAAYRIRAFDEAGETVHLPVDVRAGG
jgi:hypothetical protein